MAAPSAQSVVTSPGGLNAATRNWPYRVDEFPGDLLLSNQFGDMAPHDDASVEVLRPVNPLRVETR